MDVGHNKIDVKPLLSAIFFSPFSYKKLEATIYHYEGLLNNGILSSYYGKYIATVISH